MKNASHSSAAKPAPQLITARGHKGWKNTPWEKSFKSPEAMEKWCEKNDATVDAYLSA